MSSRDAMISRGEPMLSYLVAYLYEADLVTKSYLGCLCFMNVLVLPEYNIYIYIHVYTRRLLTEPPPEPKRPALKRHRTTTQQNQPSWTKEVWIRTTSAKLNHPGQPSQTEPNWQHHHEWIETSVRSSPNRPNQNSIYIYICMCIYLHTYIYVYIHIYSSIGLCPGTIICCIIGIWDAIDALRIRHRAPRRARSGVSLRPCRSASPPILGFF